MQAYKQYKNSINGIQDVGETVKIIEKISAAAAHPLEKKVIQIKDYTKNIESLLARLIVFYKNNDHPLLRSTNIKKRALIFITNKKGLVGGLWQKMIEEFLRNKNYYQVVIAVGEKGKSKLNRLSINVNSFFPNPVEEEWSLQAQLETEKIIHYVFEYFNQGKFDAVDILYPRFHSLADQRPIFVSLIPFEFKLRVRTRENGLPIFEQSKKDIFNHLLHKYIHAFFFQIMLETKLSELSARTISMEHAANTTDKLIKELTFKYHKNRRIMITQRQLENFTAHKILNLSL